MERLRGRPAACGATGRELGLGPVSGFTVYGLGAEGLGLTNMKGQGTQEVGQKVALSIP